MSVRRVMGIETEYGILQPGRPNANPMLLSSHVVAVHAAAREGGRTRARWDYDDEDPLHDARGFRLQRASAHPSMLTDDPAHAAPSADGPQELARPLVEEYEDPGAANVILTKPVKGSALKCWAARLAARAGMRKAKVALARKLAVVLHRMLADGKPFAAERAAAAA